MDTNFEIFKGKSFQDLCKDIVINQEEKKEQLDIIISELRPMIKEVDDAITVIPMIKDCMAASISNNEHLVKLAQIIQRLITAQAAAESENNLSLTDEEKASLLKQAECEMNILNKEILMPISSIKKED
jgi:hypothetical protein